MFGLGPHRLPAPDPRFRVDDWRPAYLDLWERGELDDRVEAALAEMRAAFAAARAAGLWRFDERV